MWWELSLNLSTSFESQSLLMNIHKEFYGRTEKHQRNRAENASPNLPVWGKWLLLKWQTKRKIKSDVHVAYYWRIYVHFQCILTIKVKGSATFTPHCICYHFFVIVGRSHIHSDCLWETTGLCRCGSYSPHDSNERRVCYTLQGKKTHIFLSCCWFLIALVFTKAVEAVS